MPPLEKLLSAPFQAGGVSPCLCWGFCRAAVGVSLPVSGWARGSRQGCVSVQDCAPGHGSASGRLRWCLVFQPALTSSHSPCASLLQRDDMEAIPGYLSLHQTADIMALKWTPNQLMNGSVGDLDYEKR